ncbi:hypothetical protein AR457_34405 [Streptomyces agglomeratus]|nr:hypothetical protein BGK70_31360 [Streptomyces agglomeratus]OEJ37110.1 hypothetical protein BGK70_01905 [Streptomyces agglomeratus]OEJ48463.1 hypothetical protein AR457_34405 [Streptomyces agglomeratus]
MPGGGIAEGFEEGIEEGFGEGGAPVVNVGAGGQAGQVGVAVGLGQVGEACGVAGDVDAAAADGISSGVCAVCAVRPVRRSRAGFGARVCHTRRMIERARRLPGRHTETLAAALKGVLK